MGCCVGILGLEKKLQDTFVVEQYYYLHPEQFKVMPKKCPLAGKMRLQFTFSISSRGAVNLAVQKQLSESRGMRGRKRRRVGREERWRE